MLVVRELLHGPKRFTDLRLGLPNASQNVLSHRLRELEQSGIVRRAKLGPPVSTWVYELTERGQELEPVLFQLGRWGSRAQMTSDGELTVDALILALETTFDPARAGSLRASYQLRLGEDAFRVDVAGGRIELARGRATDPAATIETDSRTLRALAFGSRPLADAMRSGDVKIGGDLDAVTRLLALFPRPAPARSDHD